MTSHLFTVERRSTRFNYDGLQHARSDEKMESLPGPELKMLLRLRRRIGDNGRIRIRGGVRGTSYYFGFAAANGNIRARLDVLAAPAWDFIRYTWHANGDVVITVLPPAGLRASAGAPGPIVEVDDDAPQQDGLPADRNTITCATSAPSHQDQPAAPSADLVAIPLNHDQYNQQQHDPAPAAPGLSASQVLLYTALRAHPTISHKTALALTIRYPERTPENWKRDLDNAARRPNVCPLAIVLHCWIKNEPLYVPPERERPAEAGRGTQAQPVLSPARARRSRGRRTPEGATLAPAAAPSAETLAAEDALLAQARSMAPPGASRSEINAIATYLEDGLDPATAVAAAADLFRPGGGGGVCPSA